MAQARPLKRLPAPLNAALFPEQRAPWLQVDALHLACVACGAQRKALLAVLCCLSLMLQHYMCGAAATHLQGRHPEEAHIRVLSSTSAGAQFMVNVVVRTAGAVTPSALARTVCDVATLANSKANSGASPLQPSHAIPCALRVPGTHALSCTGMHPRLPATQGTVYAMPFA